MDIVKHVIGLAETVRTGAPPPPPKPKLEKPKEPKPKAK